MMWWHWRAWRDRPQCLGVRRHEWKQESGCCALGSCLKRVDGMSFRTTCVLSRTTCWAKGVLHSENTPNWRQQKDWMMSSVTMTVCSAEWSWNGTGGCPVMILNGLRIVMGLRALHANLRRLRTTRSFYLKQQTKSRCVSRVRSSLSRRFTTYSIERYGSQGETNFLVNEQLFQDCISSQSKTWRVTALFVSPEVG